MKIKRILTVLESINEKCGLILYELARLRRQREQGEIDALIERMHHCARSLKEQCDRERDAARDSTP